MATWRNPVLERLREEHGKITGELEGAEAAWARLDGRGDFGADRERIILRPHLAGLFERRDRTLRQIAVEEERERIIGELVPRLDQETRALHVQLDAILARADVPDATTMRAFYDANRARERLRLVLHDVTHDVRFAREEDFILTVRRFWRQQAEERDRVFSHTLAPAQRGKAVPQPWDTQVRRLRELRVLDSTPKEEIINAN
jgi:hypothetical protein